MADSPVAAFVEIAATGSGRQRVRVGVRLGSAVRGFLVFAAIIGFGLGTVAYGTGKYLTPLLGFGVIVVGGLMMGALGLTARRRWSGALLLDPAGAGPPARRGPVPTASGGPQLTATGGSGPSASVEVGLSALGWRHQDLPLAGTIRLTEVAPGPRSRRTSRLYQLTALAPGAPSAGTPLATVTASPDVLRRVGHAVAATCGGTFEDASGLKPELVPIPPAVPPTIHWRPGTTKCDVRPIGRALRYGIRAFALMIIFLFAGSATGEFVHRGALALLECYGIVILFVATGVRTRVVANAAGVTVSPQTVFGLPFGPRRMLPWTAREAVLIHERDSSIAASLELIADGRSLAIPTRDGVAAAWIFAHVIRPAGATPA